MDPNFGFFYNRLNPVLRLLFQASGDQLERKYQADITTIGLKADVSIRCQMVVCYRVPFRELYYHEPIKLGRGFEVMWGLNVMWCSFADTPGGIFMVGIPVGLAAGISYITGGNLVPIEPEETQENLPTPSST